MSLRTSLYLLKSVSFAIPILIAAGLLLSQVDKIEGAQGFANAIAAQLNQTGSASIALGTVVGHEVEVVCRVPEYGSLRDAAIAVGFAVDGLPEQRVPELFWGLVLHGAGRTSYRLIGVGRLDRTYLTEPSSSVRCLSGVRLGLTFASTNPLGGGRLVDLGPVRVIHVHPG